MHTTMRIRLTVHFWYRHLRLMYRYWYFKKPWRVWLYAHAFGYLWHNRALCEHCVGEWAWCPTSGFPDGHVMKERDRS